MVSGSGGDDAPDGYANWKGGIKRNDAIDKRSVYRGRSDERLTLTIRNAIVAGRAGEEFDSEGSAGGAVECPRYGSAADTRSCRGQHREVLQSVRTAIAVARIIRRDSGIIAQVDTRAAIFEHRIPEYGITAATEEIHPASAVKGDDVAGSGNGAANGVVAGAALCADAGSAVAKRRCTAHISPNEIPLNGVVSCQTAVEVYSLATVPRDQISLSD